MCSAAEEDKEGQGDTEAAGSKQGSEEGQASTPADDTGDAKADTPAAGEGEEKAEDKEETGDGKVERENLLRGRVREKESEFE